MTFLSGQDDFFQTANQPISVRHLSEPYNKFIYSCSDEFRLKSVLIKVDFKGYSKSSFHCVYI